MGTTDLKRAVYDNLAHYGRSATLIVREKNGNNLDTGEAVFIDTSIEVRALFVKYKPFEFVEGLLGVNDWKCIIQYDGKVKNGDQVILDGTTYQVMRVGKVVMQDVLLKYTLQVRS